MEALRASGSRAAGKRGGAPDCGVRVLTWPRGRARSPTMEALRASGSRAAGKRGGTPNCSVLMLTCGGGAATLCLQRFADRARRWPVKETPEDIRKLHEIGRAGPQ